MDLAVMGAKKLKKDGLLKDQEEIGKNMRAQWADTYWYYNIFGTVAQ